MEQPSRRAVLLGIGALGAGALAACGGDDDLPTSGGEPLAELLAPYEATLLLDPRAYATAWETVSNELGHDIADTNVLRTDKVARLYVVTLVAIDALVTGSSMPAWVDAEALRAGLEANVTFDYDDLADVDRTDRTLPNLAVYTDDRLGVLAAQEAVIALAVIASAGDIELDSIGS